VSRPTVLAAGGVLWRDDPSDPEVALVHRPQYDDWSLPKGKAKVDEHLLVTAVREMTEETGHVPRIGPRLRTVRYRVTAGGRAVNKVVTYWSMRDAGGEFAGGREVDAMEWLTLPDARRRLTSDSDRVVLDTFARSSRDTEPLLLVRNGSTAAAAGPRRRPQQQRLNRSGRDQAAALVPVLEGLGATDLLSADLPACSEMLEPFAAATGLTVRRESRLSRAGFEGHERELADRVRRRACAGEVLVVCGQQRVISGLLRGLGRSADVRLPHETPLKKGGWWLLHHRDGAVAALERHEPVA